MRAIPLRHFRALLCHLHRFSYYGGVSTASFRSLHFNPTTASYSELTAYLLSLFSALAENPNNPKLLHSVDSILTQSDLLDSTASLLVLRGLAQSKKLTRAKSLLSSLKQRTQISNIFLYSIVLQCLLPLNPIRDVECVWSEVSGEPFCNFTETFVFSACQLCDDAMDVDLLCRRLLSSRWPLSRDTFAALIGALCLKKNPNPGLSCEVLNEMVERALEVDDLSYYTVFRSFCRVGDISGADSVLRSMVERRHYSLDLLVYEDFLLCLCKTGRFKEAGKLFDKILRDKRLCKSLGTVIKPGRRIIFQLRPSNMISERTAFEAYFRSLCSYGRLEEAESLLKEDMMKHITPEVCTDDAYVNALFSTGRREEAIRFFKIKRKRRDFSTADIAIAVIAGLCNSARVDEGHKLASELVNKGYVLTASVWNMILKSYCENGRVEKARHIFEGIKSGTFGAHLRPDGSTFAVMIHGLLGIGLIEKATGVLEEMERRKFAVNVDLYSVLVRNLYSSGKSQEAQGYLNYMIENGVFVSYAQWEVLFESLTSVDVDSIFPRMNQKD